jgi:alkaline phosphatase D
MKINKAKLKSILCLFVLFCSFEADAQTKKKDKGPNSKTDNFKLLNLWGEQPLEIQNLYKASYAFFSSTPGATFADLMMNTKVQDLYKVNNVVLLGGPMLGNISTDRVTVWVRTTKPSKAEIRMIVDGAAKTFGPVYSTKNTDLTAIIPVSGLKPSTNYKYQVVIDGKEVAALGNLNFHTAPKSDSSINGRIAFGSYFHRWGIGNQKQSDMIVSRKPDAMILMGDIAVQDRTNKVSLHRADYLLRDFMPAWKKLVASVPVYATWDDHDYFNNDFSGIPAGFTQKDKEKVWDVFRMAWNNPSYGFGEEGKGVFFRTRVGPADIIMVDNRYFRLGQKGSFLGKEQMEWVKKQLLDCKGPFIILSCGTMWSDFVSNGKDSWGANDPQGREDLFNFIEKNKIGGVLLTSGDRHGARGFRITRPSGFSFYEFEAASLGGRSGPPVTNPLWDTQFYGIAAKYAFGEFTFETNVADPKVTFRLVGDDGSVIKELKLSRSQLTPKTK